MNIVCSLVIEMWKVCLLEVVVSLGKILKKEFYDYFDTRYCSKITARNKILGWYDLSYITPCVYHNGYIDQNKKVWWSDLKDFF